MHAFLHKSRRENHRRVVFTQQDTIYSRAHLVLTNLLITSLLVLCFSRWFLLFLPPNILLISCHPRLLFWYLLFRYRWAHHLCFLSMNDLSRSSFFDLSIYLSNYLSIYLKTSYCFCHISKQKDLFCRPRTHGSNWRENCLLEREKNRKIWENDSRSWFT